MRTRPGFGETLPALLRRRHGISERRAAVGIVAVVAAVAAVAAVLYDPLGGRTQLVHRGAPVFNLVYPPDLARPVAVRPGEYERLLARRGGLRFDLAVRPLRLPPYRGEPTGVLPLMAERRRAAFARALPGFQVIAEGRARMHGAPAYETAFRFGPPGRRSTGREVLVVPPDRPGVRAGLAVTLRERHRLRGAPGARARDAQKAMRAAARSLVFGTGRDY